MKNSQREIWVDNVKVIACLLVVLGHFFVCVIEVTIQVEGDCYEGFDDK